MWADEDIDLSIVKIEKIGLKTVELGDSDKMKIGNKVFAIGNPIGLEFERTVTSGIVSAVDRTIKIKEDEKLSYMEDLIQTDATINSGNSGGPLINENGEVVGINSVKIDNAEGIGFAIPINIIKPIIEKYKTEGTFNEASIGIYAYDKEVIQYLDNNVKFDKGNIPYIKDDDLGTLDNKLSGITINKIDKDEMYSNTPVVEFSNGLKLAKGEKFFPEIFGEKYQITMIKTALKRHFEAELENVKREDKIKTLCLFFIDSIDAYRNNNAPDKKGWLRIKFEEILNEYLKQQINIVEKDIQNGYDLQDYKKYLEASLNNISETNGGYFCKDNNEKDEDIKREIDDILINKEKLLSFTNIDGSYNLRRFLFSKWTLREGWDNPNVFTIAKLRSSGSEISKLQEVGRGLRLPVDVDGNRKKEQFYLNYIVDASEKDFAKMLINQINSEVIAQINIKNFIKEYSEQTGEKFLTVAAKLSESDFIDDDYILNMDKFEELSEIYPEISEKIITMPQFNKGLKKGKIIERSSLKDKEKVKIRPEKFNELKDLWEIINRKYFIKFEDIPENIILKSIEESINESKNAITEIITTRVMTVNNKESVDLKEVSGQSYKYEKPLKYNEVLKKVSQKTNLPILTLHKGFIKFHQNNSAIDINSMLNENFVQKLIQSCNDRMQESISKYSYEKLDVSKKETSLTYSNGKVKEYVTKSDIGVKLLENYDTPNNYLYESLLYDSDLEKKNLQLSSQSEVIVFGKIPRRSIQIPTYFGENYSPDFMYVIKNDNSVKKLFCIVETKNVNSDSDKRQKENEKIKCAKKFYAKLQEDLKDQNIKLYYKEQKVYDSVTQIIHELLNNS